MKKYIEASPENEFIIAHKIAINKISVKPNVNPLFKIIAIPVKYDSLNIKEKINDIGKNVIANPIKVINPDKPPYAKPICSFGHTKYPERFISVIITNDEQKIIIKNINTPKNGKSAAIPDAAPNIKENTDKFLISSLILNLITPNVANSHCYCICRIIQRRKFFIFYHSFYHIGNFRLGSLAIPRNREFYLHRSIFKNLNPSLCQSRQNDSATLRYADYRLLVFAKEQLFNARNLR